MKTNSQSVSQVSLKTLKVSLKCPSECAWILSSFTKKNQKNVKFHHFFEKIEILEPRGRSLVEVW